MQHVYSTHLWCVFVVCVCGVCICGVCLWCVFVVCVVVCGGCGMCVHGVVCVCGVCGVCVWSVCKATLARSRVIGCAFKVVPQYLSEESETRLFTDCEPMVHGFLLSTYNSLPGGGVTKITDIIFMVQHATIDSLRMP